MDMRPFTSLIIPTYQRSGMLIETLSYLRWMDYPAERLELIVVTDRLEANLSEAISMMEFPFMYQIVEQAGQGAAIRRNHGAALARGELLIFIDDDMSAGPQFVSAHADAHGQAENRVVIGYFPPAPTGRVGFLQLELRDWWETNFYNLREPGHRFTYQDLSAGNFSLRRGLFEQTGGFQVDFVCREDYELGKRLLDAGAQFVYCEAARCIHRDHTEIEHALRRKQEEGAAEVQLGLAHPQLRPQLLMTSLLDQAQPAGAFLRTLAFHMPGLGDLLAGLIRSLLPAAEALNLRYLWRRLQLGLSFYHYWCGVASRLPNLSAVRMYLNEFEAVEQMEPELVLDLFAGVEAAELALEKAHPNSVRLVYHSMPLGVIPPRAGAERLRGPHLRPFIVNNLSLGLARVVLREHLSRLPAPVAAQAASCPGEGFQLVELAGVSPGSITAITSEDSSRSLLRFQGHPLKWVRRADLRASGSPRRAEAEQIFDPLLPILLGLDARLPLRPENIPLFSIVICTRDRPHLLEGCLQALAALTYPNLEILVIDNAPTSPATEQLCQQYPVRYAREDRPGLDLARNTGWQLANGSLVAYTDDDARPDPGWLDEMAAVLSQPHVMAATGPVLPCELVTPAQIAFEDSYGGMSHGFEYHCFRRGQLSDRQLLWASGFGVGANMAFRRAVLAELGGFDPGLDVGTPAAGGGDVELFHRLVAAGYSLVYTPAPFVWHLHRRSWEELQQQIYNNGRSFGVYLLTCWRHHSVRRGSLISFAIFEWFGKWLLKRLIRPGKWPRRLVLSEIRGALSAPVAYLQSRRAASSEENRLRFSSRSGGEP